MLICLKEEPEALKFFKCLGEGEQRSYIQWIYSSKKEETKIGRLANAIDLLLKKQKLIK